MFEEDLHRARDLIKSGKKIEAREILERIVHADPQNDTAWMWLADTYPDNPSRYAVLQECLKYNPNNHFVQKWLESFKLEYSLESAIDLIKTEKKVEAREILEHIVQADPQNDTAWIWLAYTYPDTLSRISVLQECLNHNPNSHIAQKWLATARAEEAILPDSLKQASPVSKSGQSEHVLENVGKSAVYSEYSNATKSKPKLKNSRLVIILASILGIILLGSMVIYGVWMLQKRGAFSGIGNKKPIAGLPTATFVPSSTLAIPVIPVVETPTLTSIPTMPLAPSMTSTPTSISSSVTEILTPMPALAQQAIGVAVNLGFKPQSDACGQLQSCQAYLSAEPYMLMVIMHTGLVTITMDDVLYLSQNSVPTPGAIIPNNTQLLWYEYVIGDIYNPFSSDFGKDAAVVMDRTMKYGSYDWESYYGYKINGIQSATHKIILTITPP